MSFFNRYAKEVTETGYGGNKQTFKLPVNMYSNAPMPFFNLSK